MLFLNVRLHPKDFHPSRNDTKLQVSSMANIQDFVFSISIAYFRVPGSSMFVDKENINLKSEVLYLYLPSYLISQMDLLKDSGEIYSSSLNLSKPSSLLYILSSYSTSYTNYSNHFFNKYFFL